MDYEYPDALSQAASSTGGAAPFGTIELGSVFDAGQAASQQGNAGNLFAGTLQNLAALTTGAVSRWVDIELDAKAAGLQPRPVLGTTQGQVFVRQAGVPQPGGVTAKTAGLTGGTLLNLDALLPFALVGAVVWFLARKG